MSSGVQWVSMKIENAGPAILRTMSAAALGRLDHAIVIHDREHTPLAVVLPYAEWEKRLKVKGIIYMTTPRETDGA